MKVNGGLLRSATLIIIVAMIHFLWLTATVKWTSAGLLFFSFTTIVAMGLMATCEKWPFKTLWMQVLIGFVAGSIAGVAAWVISDAIVAPDRARMFLQEATGLSLDFVLLVAYSLMISGFWLVGILYSLVIFKFRRS